MISELLVVTAEFARVELLYPVAQEVHGASVRTSVRPYVRTPVRTFVPVSLRTSVRTSVLYGVDNKTIRSRPARLDDTVLEDTDYRLR